VHRLHRDKAGGEIGWAVGVSARTIAVIILLAIVLSSLPYALGYFSSSPQQHFMGLTYNIDDACVYLSWMRQTADGSVLIRNQFAVEPQKNLQFNMLFLALGWLARLTHLPLIAVYHLARVIFGALLLWIIYCFSRRFFDEEEPRIAVLILAAFSSGIGWMFGAGSSRSLPVDLWQPEAITFLSLYLNPLFLCAQVLMLASFMFLLRCKESGRVRHAMAAGMCLLLLANIHTYDVVTVAAVWAAFVLADYLSALKINTRLLLLSAVAAAISVPAVLYQWYLFHSEEVFRLRVETPALSPPVWQYLAGFGLVLLLALVGIPSAVRRKGNALLPAAWAIIGFALPYAPFSQQRKLVMGIHIPLVVLSVYALVWLSRRVNRPILPIALLLAIAAIPSNLVFLRRDVNWLVHNETATQMHRPFLSDSELRGLQWLRLNSQHADSVLAFPDIAVFVPAIAGARTYVGHWSETPHFARKLGEWRDFASATESDEKRMEFLLRSRTTYVWWDSSLRRLPSKKSGGPSENAFAPRDAWYLKKVFESGKIGIYRFTGKVNR
jgi:hypothetical protein